MASLLKNENRLSNETRNVTPQCKVVVYVWDQLPLHGETVKSPGNIFDNLTPNPKLSASTALDISSQITAFSYTKNNSGPTGNFTLGLSNSPGIGSGDWKDILKRGMWILVKLSQDGDLAMNPRVGPPIRVALGDQAAETKKIRCIGYIDRVAALTTTDDTGALSVSYQVTGRDFGVVYSDNIVWHNLFTFDQKQLTTIHQTKMNVLGSTKLDKILDVVHDLYFDPTRIAGLQTNIQDSLVSHAQQWLLPDKLILDLGIRQPPNSYWGSLPDVKQFSTTEASLAVSSPIDFLSGSAWDNLKKISVAAFHELYTETTDDGKPGLHFRPIPWAIDKKKYPFIGQHIARYKDLDLVTFPTNKSAAVLGVNSNAAIIPAVDVLNANLAEDDQNRYNSFLVTIASTAQSVENNITFLEGTRFPLHIQDSIKRHGFRPMHVTVDTLIRNAALSNGLTDGVVALEYNECLYDYWHRAVFAESGSTTIVGNNAVKIGKILLFGPDVPYANGKRYYIEGYSDNFTVGEKGERTWDQTVNVTNGYEESDLTDIKDFGTKENRFKQEGEYTPAGGM